MWTGRVIWSSGIPRRRQNFWLKPDCQVLYYKRNICTCNRKLGEKQKSSQKIHSSHRTRGLSRLDCLGLAATSLAARPRLQLIS